MKKNIKLIYEYDGSSFYGFQKQPKLRTVQGEIEKVLEILFKESINLVSAGRTDRGVHAKMQVSNFYTNLSIPIEKIKKVLNELLPKDINILEVEEADLGFNSRYSALYRAYEYFITDKKSAFTSKYLTYIAQELDVERLNQISKTLCGKHNFENFKLSDCGSKTSIREIYEIEFTRIDKNSVRLYVKGNGFLKSQIRIIVGTVLAIHQGKKNENYLKEMLDNPEKEYSKIVAEPNGLYLSEIGY